LAENQRLRTRKQQLRAELGGFRVAHDRLLTEYERLNARKQQLKARKQQLKAEVQGLNDGRDLLSSENQELRRALEETQAAHDRLSEQLGCATAELEGIRAELGEVMPAEARSLAEERALLRLEVERLGGEIQHLCDERTVHGRTVDQLKQTDMDLNTALAEGNRFAGLLQERDERLEAARATEHRLGVDRQKVLDEAQRLRSALAESEETRRDEASRLRADSDQLRCERDGLRRDVDCAREAHGAELTRLQQQLHESREQAHDVDVLRAQADWLRAEREQLRIEGDRLRSQVEELRGTLDHAERAHRDEYTRLQEQLQMSREQVQDADVLRAQADWLRAEREEFCTECDRLRSQVDELRRTLHHIDLTHRDEVTRLHAELAVFAKQHDRMRYDESIRILVERDEPREELIEGLAQLMWAGNAPYKLTFAPPRFGFQPGESVADSGQAAELDDAPEHEPAPPRDRPLTPDQQLEATSANVEELTRKLTRSEKRQRELASMLDGLGVQFSKGQFKKP
jgi:chromosome segregation ATPase